MNREQLLAGRWNNLLRTWLASLSAAGWSGTVGDLAAELEALDAERKIYAFVPRGAGLTKALQVAESLFAAAGWSIAWKRTAKARTIEVAPIKRRGRKGA